MADIGEPTISRVRDTVTVLCGNCTDDCPEMDPAIDRTGEVLYICPACHAQVNVFQRMRFEAEAERVFGIPRGGLTAYLYAEARISGADICKALRYATIPMPERWKHGHRVN